MNAKNVTLMCYIFLCLFGFRNERKAQLMTSFKNKIYFLELYMCKKHFI